VYHLKVAIFFGSLSDKKVMEGAAKALKELGVQYECFVLSAHRVPERLMEIVKDLENNGFEVVIAGAGMAAHLPGVIASHTLLPVIGVPVNATLQGVDALLSIAQMPKSIPVATVGIDNSFNAGILAVEMLALKYTDLKVKLINYRKEMKEAYLRESEKGVEM
jgi:5-(carboxyamino)imidazole ribonucleotide mutase